jgi:hypothetical protein
MQNPKYPFVLSVFRLCCATLNMTGRKQQSRNTLSANGVLVFLAKV